MGSVDILINNAGISIPHSFLETTPEELDQIIDVNLKGVFYMAQTVAAHGGMMCHLAGKPINLGFLLGTRRYNCNVSFLTVGTKLTVKVERLIQDQGLGVFLCQVSGQGVDISAKLNVYLPDSEENRANN